MACASEQEAVRHTRAVPVRADHVSLGINPESLRRLHAFLRVIDGKELPSGHQETMDFRFDVGVNPHDLAGWVHIPRGGRDAAGHIERRKGSSANDVAPRFACHVRV